MIWARQQPLHRLHLLPYSQCLSSRLNRGMITNVNKGTRARGNNAARPKMSQLFTEGTTSQLKMTLSGYTAAKVTTAIFHLSGGKTV